MNFSQDGIFNNVQAKANCHSGTSVFESLEMACCDAGARVDVVVVHNSGEEDKALQVAEMIEKYWKWTVDPDNLKEVEQWLERWDCDEGIDEIDMAPGDIQASCKRQNGEPLFPADPRDCDQCQTNPTPLFITVLDGMYLLQDDFLEAVQRLMMTGKIMVLPVLTHKFLSNPELQVRTFYLKKRWFAETDHFAPLYLDPIKMPNYLFEHVNGFRLFALERWGRVNRVPHGYVEKSLKKFILEFFMKKVKCRGRKCRNRKPEPEED